LKPAPADFGFCKFKLRNDRARQAIGEPKLDFAGLSEVTSGIQHWMASARTIS